MFSSNMPSRPPSAAADRRPHRLRPGAFFEAADAAPPGSRKRLEAACFFRILSRRRRPASNRKAAATAAATKSKQPMTEPKKATAGGKRGEGVGVVTTGIVEVTKEPSAGEEGMEEMLEFGVAAAQGPRGTMEDEAVVFPNGKCGFLYSMVLDGHDGLPAVQWLADHMFGIFSDAIDEEMYTGACQVDDLDANTGLCCPMSLSPVLKESFHAADRELLKHLKKLGGIKAAKSGSTATIALVKEDRIVVANVGDSRAVLCRKGQPFDLTTEHRVYGWSPSVKSETERVKSVGGWINDGRVCDILAVSRAFGDWEMKGEGLKYLLEDGIQNQYWTKEFAEQIHFTGDPVVSTPDVTELTLGDGDEFVIVATDGVWDVMSSSDAIRFVQRQKKRGDTIQKIADGLCQLALKRYTADNVAVVIIDLLAAKQRLEKASKTKTTMQNSNSNSKQISQQKSRVKVLH